jgi:hypothetical protein
MPAAPGMKIKTDTPMVKKAREGVMEFLLVRGEDTTRPCARSARALINSLVHVAHAD